MIFQVLYCGDPLDACDNAGSAFTVDAFMDNIVYIYNPADPLWYILSLVFWRIMFKNLPPSLLKNWKLCMLSVLSMSLIAGFIPLGMELAFQKTFAFFPYFVLGYYLHKYDLLLMIRQFRKSYGFLVIFLYFLTICIVPKFPLSMLLQYSSYGDLSNAAGVNILVIMCMRIVSWVWSLPLTIVILAVIPDLKWFAREGKYTLFYFIYHAYFVAVFHLMVVNLQFGSSLLHIFLYSIIIVLALYWLRKIRFLRLLAQPIKS